MFASHRAIAEGGVAKGLQTVLMTVLLKPESVYRQEIGLGAKDQHGRRRLSEFELAFALSHALSDKGPSRLRVPKENEERDAKSSPNLLDLAQKGELSTREGIQRVVRKILDANDMSRGDYTMFAEDHKVGNPTVLRFFQEFFGYHHAPRVFKDAKRIGIDSGFETKRMVNDADQLVMHIFDEDKDVLKRLLTTNHYFVAYCGSRKKVQKDLDYIRNNVNDANYKNNVVYFRRQKAAGRTPIPIEGTSTRSYVGFYNFDHETWDYPLEQPTAMPEGQRIGILTHPAWLIAWSGNFDNDPIRRGKWIREHLLAGTVPDVPITVNAVVPEDPHKTLRQRLEATRAPECSGCHEKMNPLGLPFESFDDFGRFRQKEMLGAMLTIFPERHRAAKYVDLDTRGAVLDSGDASIDGPVRDVRELMNRLANSDRVRQSFVRHAFRFWFGRNETYHDSPTLIAADKAYVAEGGSMKAMLASFLSSDSFLYRK
ncbi:MAG: DUF1588 domain-containing protein [Planctomycetota bacterium]